MPGEQEVRAGQAVYSKPVLRLYDFWVLGISNRCIWRCPTPRLLEHYDRHVSGNHLDVGVGSGYYLDRCHFPTEAPRVALMDLNGNSLAVTARRIARYAPLMHRTNVLDAIGWDTAPFDSIGINYLLHCLPGSIGDKAVAFDHLRPLLRPGGVVFGATLLQKDVPRTAAARRLMAAYNARGIFCNEEDTRAGLEAALARRFEDYAVEVVGCAGLFWARV